MLYVQEKVVKLGGIYLEGQVTSVDVQEAGSVYVAQDEKGRYKKSQPVGYENAKVMIDILLEDTQRLLPHWNSSRRCSGFSSLMVRTSRSFFQ